MEVTEPYHYLAALPGKNVRELLISAFNQLLQLNDSQVTLIQRCISTLHTASMLIDDVEDNATTRRGAPAAHVVFGLARTINCSHYVVFEAMSSLEPLGPGCQHIFLDEILHLHHGQGLDIYWRDLRICPTEQQYIEMVADKTGGLLRMAVRLMLELAPPAHINREILDKLPRLIGILYQIQDDLLNLTSSEYQKSKGFCEDLTEGKYSFPVIHSLSHGSPAQKEFLEKTLQAHTTDPELKKKVLDVLRDTGSFEYTRQTVIRYHAQVLQLVGDLQGDTSMLVKALSKMLLV